MVSGIVGGLVVVAIGLVLLKVAVIGGILGAIALVLLALLLLGRISRLRKPDLNHLTHRRILMADPVPAGSDVAGTYRCTDCGYKLSVASTNGCRHVRVAPPARGAR